MLILERAVPGQGTTLVFRNEQCSAPCLCWEASIAALGFGQPRSNQGFSRRDLGTLFERSQNHKRPSSFLMARLVLALFQPQSFTPGLEVTSPTTKLHLHWRSGPTLLRGRSSFRSVLKEAQSHEGVFLACHSNEGTARHAKPKIR